MSKNFKKMAILQQCKAKNLQNGDFLALHCCIFGHFLAILYRSEPIIFDRNYQKLTKNRPKSDRCRPVNQNDLTVLNEVQFSSPSQRSPCSLSLHFSRSTICVGRGKMSLFPGGKVTFFHAQRKLHIFVQFAEQNWTKMFKFLPRGLEG